MDVTPGPAGATTLTAHRRVSATWRIARWAVPAGLLAVLVQRLGADPFLRAFDRVGVGSVVVVVLVTAATTACAAARWTWVARRLGLRLEMRWAVAAYYRSLLVNQVLPGGVVGDVERAFRHGHDQAAVSRAARAVAWERAVGQVGLLAVTLVAVAGFPSALRGSLVWAVPTTLAVLGVATLAVAAVRRPVPRLARSARATLVEDLRRLTSGGPPWTPLLLSTAAAAGHLVVLLVALRTARVDVPLSHAVPLLAVVLVASSLPTNIAGWGPREGAAAWVFGAAGLAAADGVTVATVYGILSLAATAPGVVVLGLGILPRRMEASTT